MCWAAKRQTTKVEDRAYSLLGILGVNMPSIYGIDGIAFEDLQHKIITKSDDQTLFSWYHACMPAENVKMEDVVSISGLIRNDDDGTPPFNTTGLLASSPSHYVKSYEISAEDFRKNYVDRIREFTYRSCFSIDNNYILIPLPVKHMVGKVWKAVLRCSFEPPDGHERQCPLVIYLKEIDHLRYVWVHLQVAPNEWELKEDGVQICDVPGIPGSLDRLSDAELQLQGYVLREIDMLA
ncbi:hypothetical protein JVU11DRAFT_5837 [Chiua virens]|nr:hypothetical protein JVU11DRAFT_5837 [Chiua virens]